MGKKNRKKGLSAKQKRVAAFWNDVFHVVIFNAKTKQKHTQLLSKRAMVDRTCVFTNKVNGDVVEGRVMGIMEDSGKLVFACVAEGDVEVDETKTFMVIKE